MSVIVYGREKKRSFNKGGVDIFDLEMYLELKENGFEFEGQSYLFWERYVHSEENTSVKLNRVNHVH